MAKRGTIFLKPEEEKKKKKLEEKTGAEVVILEESPLKPFKPTGGAPTPQPPPTPEPAPQTTSRKRAVKLPSGKVVFASPEVEQEIKATPEAQRVQVMREQQEAAREEAAIVAPIPEARELGGTVGAFEEAQIGRERSGMQLLAETPLGQAIIGKVGLDELKNQGKAQELLDLTNYMLENGLTPQQVSADPATQMILSLELNEKDIELLKSGEAEVGGLALLIEGLPLKGLGIGKYITTTPTERIKALQSKIEKMGNTIRDYRMAAARTPANADKYLTLIEKTELKIRDAESRIKLMIIQSPSLQNAPEDVEVTQEVINRALNRIGDARNAIRGGETLEMAIASNQI